jgi:hypothetical protein
MQINSAEHIGDGVYATFDGYQVKIWTNDGEHKSDVIYIDEYTAEELVAFFIKCFGK